MAYNKFIRGFGVDPDTYADPHAGGLLGLIQLVQHQQQLARTNQQPWLRPLASRLPTNPVGSGSEVGRPQPVMSDASPDPVRPGDRYAQQALQLCRFGPGACAVGAGLTAGQMLLGGAAAGGLGALLWKKGEPKPPPESPPRDQTADGTPDPNFRGLRRMPDAAVVHQSKAKSSPDELPEVPNTEAPLAPDAPDETQANQEGCDQERAEAEQDCLDAMRGRKGRKPGAAYGQSPEDEAFDFDKCLDARVSARCGGNQEPTKWVQTKTGSRRKKSPDE